jgi:hypothetical protein
MNLFGKNLGDGNRSRGLPFPAFYYCQMSCDKNVFSMDVFLGLSRFATRDAGDLCRDNAPSTANSSFIFEYT